MAPWSRKGKNDDNKGEDAPVGDTDEAATEDKFGIETYYKGAAEFIENCNTPMTLSVQGSWGTGKTSIMQLIQKELRKQNEQQELDKPHSIKTIWFNTWQFSQFDMGNQLAVSLFENLIHDLDLDDNDEAKTNLKLTLEKLKVLGKASAGIGLDVLKNFYPSIANVAKSVGAHGAEAAKDLKGGGDEPFDDQSKLIRDLRERFEKCITNVIEGKGKNKQPYDRVVIFIDDLDRLAPRKAVELLEVLKLFMNCKGCVFVLAIDYDVVVRGVAEKYENNLADDNTSTAEKGRSFFDKIIQVPFKVPVARYDIDNYVKNHLEQIYGSLGTAAGNVGPQEQGAGGITDQEVEDYVGLIKESVGTNPRSMNRLFNSFQLLKIIAGAKYDSDGGQEQPKIDDKLLFAILCLQNCNEHIYTYLVSTNDALTANQFDALTNPPMKTTDGEEKTAEDAYEDFLRSLGVSESEITEDDLAQSRGFLTVLRRILVKSGSDTIEPEELDSLKQTLNFSTITSYGTSAKRTTMPPTPVDSIDDLTYKTPEDKACLKRFMKQIEDVFGDKAELAPLKIYHHSNEKVKVTVSYHFTFNNRFRVTAQERNPGFSLELESKPDILRSIYDAYRPRLEESGFDPSEIPQYQERNKLIRVRVIDDRSFEQSRIVFEECKRLLEEADKETDKQ